jgi:hypothetical protein
LLSLEQLTLNMLFDEFKTMVVKQPNLTLKKLHLMRYLVNGQSLAQISEMFPNLTNLQLHCFVSILLMNKQ